MLKIRLTRVGKKNSPAYRVVIADKKRAVKGKFIEIIGNYNPTLKPKQIVIDKDRALFWMERGAQASDTVNNLMCDLEILPKKNKIKTTFGKKFTKKALKEGADKKPAAPAVEAIAESPEEPKAEPEAEAEITPTEESQIETPVVEAETEIPAVEVEVENTEEDPKEETKKDKKN
jgi:small subunit ribosomal protein S16